jgi:hypothetical protein
LFQNKIDNTAAESAFLLRVESMNFYSGFPLTDNNPGFGVPETVNAAWTRLLCYLTMDAVGLTPLQVTRLQNRQ